MKIERFFAAFILLSLITALLLAYSVRFFYAAFNGMGLSAWASQTALSSVLGRADGGDGSQETTARSASLLNRAWSAVDFAAAPSPTLQPTMTPLVLQPTQTLEPVQVEPTPVPVFEVIEEPPPNGSLVIPKLDVDQPLATVPVRDGAWDLEDLGTQVGWLQTTGTRPHDDLSMVLVGHITLPYPGGAGPFLYLSTLEPGDVVGYRSGSETYIYEVKGQTIVEPDQVDQLYRSDGKTLLLVTCTGYNALELRYDLRLVVEAELVSVEK